MSPPSIASTHSDSRPPFRSATSSPVAEDKERFTESPSSVAEDKERFTESPSSAATIVNVSLDYKSPSDEKKRVDAEDDANSTKLSILSPPAPPTTSGPASQPKDIRFYLVFLSICCSIFLSALDLTSVSTALPSSESIFARQFE
jgi:hypothetical protein